MKQKLENLYEYKLKVCSELRCYIRRSITEATKEIAVGVIEKVMAETLPIISNIQEDTQRRQFRVYVFGS